MKMEMGNLYLQICPTCLKLRIPIKIKNKIKKYPIFYQKVWLECLKIPMGQTRTYGWIAKRIGIPNAARAVGQALAKNPFAPLVPCHRVICSNGSLGGYSGIGGNRKKKELLSKEFELLGKP